MKRICALILVLLFALTNVCYSYADSDIRYLKNEGLEQWGILALYSSGEKFDNIKLEKPQSNINTDYQSYVVGALCLGKNVEEEVKKMKNSQLDNGKFSDYINKNGTELVNAHIWGIISLYLADSEDYNKEKALSWLKDNQSSDGGFPVYSGETYNDLDLTAMGLIAYSILGLPNNSHEIQKGIQYIEENLDMEETCETVSWYIIARKFLGLSVPEHLHDRLTEYKLDDATYAHTKVYAKSNYIATYTGIIGQNEYIKDVSILKQIHYLNAFSDLSDTDDVSSIIYLLEKGIVSGYPDGTFKPDKPVSRSEFAKMLIYSLDKQDIKYSQNVFNDMNSHWAKDAANIAYEEKLMNGVRSSTFAPEDKITGAQIAAIAVRAKGFENISNLYDGDSWYYGYVKVAEQFNLLYDSFDPEKNATRAQCAQGIYRLIN